MNFDFQEMLRSAIKEELSETKITAFDIIFWSVCFLVSLLFL